MAEPGGYPLRLISPARELRETRSSTDRVLSQQTSKPVPFRKQSFSAACYAKHYHFSGMRDESLGS